MAYDPDNIFARILRGDAAAHKVYEDEQSLAIMDVMPQADGHVLILPKTPAQNLFELEETSLAALLRTAQVVAAGVRDAFDADGVRLMQLNGPAAGQTVFHFHIHIIPCHEGRPLKRHAGGMADNDLLAEHAARIRAVLDTE